MRKRTARIVTAPDLAAAAAATIAFGAQDALQDARSAHLSHLAEAALRLSAEDRSARHWSAGRLADCQTLSHADARYEFCQRLTGSASFGELIASTVERALVGLNGDPRSRDVAQLINIFITAFDGLCDEVPEYLPLVLPALTRLFTNFPEPTEERPRGNHPVVWLAFESASAATALLEPALAASRSQFREAFIAAVRAAFATQVDSIKPPSPGMSSHEVRVRRSSISLAAFHVAVLVPAAFHPSIQDDLQRLRTVANALGDHFGWIDDLVDIDHDVRVGQENIVASHLAEAHCLQVSGEFEPEGLRFVCEDAASRWRSLLNILKQQNLLSDDVETALRIASLAWLGGGV